MPIPQRPRKQVEAEIYARCNRVLDALPNKQARLGKSRRVAMVSLAKAFILLVAGVVVVLLYKGTEYGDHYDEKNGYIIHTTMINDPAQPMIMVGLVMMGVGVLWTLFALRRLMRYKFEVLDRLRYDVLGADPALKQEFEALPPVRQLNGGRLAAVIIAGMILYAAFAIYLSGVLA